MRAFRLWLLGMFLVTVVNIVNRARYKNSIKDLSKAERKMKMYNYDLQEAKALNSFGNRNYRTLWNDIFKKPEGYKFGVDGEMMSSALGKNEVDKTLTKKGEKGLVKYVFGERMVRILNKLDPNHCFNAIDLTKGDWSFPKKE